MTAVLCSVAEGSHVRNGYIHIVRIECAVEQGGLSAFADTGSNPFSGIYVFECGCYRVQIIGGTFGCKVSPVFGFGSGFQEIAVFHKYHIGIEEPGKFLAILGLERVGGSISFGYNDRGTIEARMRHDNPLAETSFLGMPVVERLGEIDSNGWVSVMAEISLSFCCKPVCADKDTDASKNVNSSNAVWRVRRSFIMCLFVIGDKDNLFSSSGCCLPDKKGERTTITALLSPANLKQPTKEIDNFRFQSLYV